jgi:hypothetical protein
VSADAVKSVARGEETDGGDCKAEAGGDLAGCEMGVWSDEGEGAGGVRMNVEDSMDPASECFDWTVGGIMGCRMVDSAAFDAVFLVRDMDGGRGGL